MQPELRRSLFVPLHYWRTIVLMSLVGSAVAAVAHDSVAVLFATIACAFVFSRYERRRWIVLPTQLWAGDIIVRIAFAFALTYVLCVPKVTLMS